MITRTERKKKELPPEGIRIGSSGTTNSLQKEAPKRLYPGMVFPIKTQTI